MLDISESNREENRDNNVSRFYERGFDVGFPQMHQIAHRLKYMPYDRPVLSLFFSLTRNGATKSP